MFVLQFSLLTQGDEGAHVDFCTFFVNEDGWIMKTMASEKKKVLIHCSTD